MNQLSISRNISEIIEQLWLKTQIDVNREQEY